jgi:adenosylcobinamide amidohydrolase
MTWEVLAEQPHLRIKRQGRFLLAEMDVPARVISTSVEHGGQAEGIRYLLNHQSCEGTGHELLHKVLGEIGHTEYHRRMCTEAAVPADATALMGTAANMRYAAVTVETDADVTVTAAVTAGVQGNATCAGDPARWREGASGFERVVEYAGTINTILVINRPLTYPALARSVLTMTEGKSAALQRLAVPSRQSPDLATGTGTDQYCLASLDTGGPPLTSASSHVKLGELIGRAVRTATLEALRWQNGLEPSYTRSVFHALGRYGVDEVTFLDDIAPLLSAGDLELMRKNIKSVTYEPLVGVAAHALGTVLDRIRHGTVPGPVERDATIQMAATLAANVASRPECWVEFRDRLHRDAATDPKSLVLAAIALGWSEKWRSN